MRKPLRSKTRKAAVGKRKRASRYVYYFGDGHADGRGTMKALLGGKGANLHEMTRIGLPVPPGFTITTEVCSYFYDHDRSYPAQLEAQVAAAMAMVEKSTGKRLKTVLDFVIFFTGVVKMIKLLYLVYQVYVSYC